MVENNSHSEKGNPLPSLYGHFFLIIIIIKYGKNHLQSRFDDFDRYQYR